MKKYLFIVLLVGVWGCRSQKPQNNLYIYDPETFGLSKKALIKMSNEVFKYVDNGKIPFVSKAIIKDNHLIYFDSYGYADIESKKEIRDDSIFRIYSMTKPIVSVAIMILIERGLIELDDPVKNYLKEFNELVVFNDSLKFKKPENDMSISDLLSHKSGLGYGWEVTHILILCTQKYGIKKTIKSLLLICPLYLYSLIQKQNGNMASQHMY